MKKRKKNRSRPFLTYPYLSLIPLFVNLDFFLKTAREWPFYATHKIKPFMFGTRNTQTDPNPTNKGLGERKDVWGKPRRFCPWFFNIYPNESFRFLLRPTPLVSLTTFSTFSLAGFALVKIDFSEWITFLSTFHRVELWILTRRHQHFEDLYFPPPPPSNHCTCIFIQSVFDWTFKRVRQTLEGV